ncbi:MAG TPA: hypothetical protein DD640_02125 [Clostridiales bacterium]|nr:hypothetical protein [Clostridiales bacterium]
MPELQLKEADSVDLDCEYRLSDISSIRNCYNFLHSHDFFEILIVVSGSFQNYVNGQVLQGRPGSLIFFRPQDRHRIDPEPNRECHLINITYRQMTFRALCAYLGDSFDPAGFLHAALPPAVILSGMQLQEFMVRLNELNTLALDAKPQRRAAWRLILSELYYRCFCRQEPVRAPDCPDWLTRLGAMMQNRENFTGGAAVMTALSGKSQAYLCRCFRKYLRTTPVGYVNALRLNYARNLLLNTDRSILDISLDIGFSSLGHFYRLFAGQFGMPPLQYRRENWQSHHGFANSGSTAI